MKRIFDVVLSVGILLISFRSDRNISHFTSTRTLFLINAYSEKYSAIPRQTSEYLPSIGEIESKSYFFILNIYPKDAIIA